MKAYEKATQKKRQTDKALFSLAWQLEELRSMCEESRLLRAELTVVMNLLTSPATNLPLRLSKIREKLHLSAKAASKYRRQACICVYDFCRKVKPKALCTAGSLCAKQKPKGL